MTETTNERVNRWREIRDDLATNITLFSHHRAELLRLLDEQIAAAGRKPLDV